MRFEDLDIIDDEGRYHAPDPELVALASELLKVYKELRPKYVPGSVRVSKKAYHSFYKAAILCKSRGMSPYEFIKNQLEGMAMTGHFWPGAIASEKFLDIAKDNIDPKLMHIRFYKAQLDLFRLRINLYGPQTAVRDDANQFSPLFRCCMAHQYGVPEIVERFKEDALLELSAVPEAAEIFDTGFLNV